MKLHPIAGLAKGARDGEMNYTWIDVAKLSNGKRRIVGDNSKLARPKSPSNEVVERSGRPTGHAINAVLDALPVVAVRVVVLCSVGVASVERLF